MGEKRPTCPIVEPAGRKIDILLVVEFNLVESSRFKKIADFNCLSGQISVSIFYRIGC